MLRDFTKDEFDIIIQAGQSNSDGTGFGDASRPFGPSDKVWHMTGDFVISKACEIVSGNKVQSNYSLAFAREYIDRGLLKEGRKLLILRTSVGGTGFLDKRWGPKDDLYLRMMEMIKTALELNKNNKLVAFLWHQGETDAVNKASFDTHYSNLSGLLACVRNTFGCPELPFIAGDFVAQWKQANAQICEPVVAAIEDVCNKMPPAAFVTTDELCSNDQTFGGGDNIHFSREALYKLGVKYFSAFEKIKK